MRRGIFSTILVAAFLYAAPALGESEDFGKSAVAQALIKRATQTRGSVESAPRVAEPSKPSVPWTISESVPEDVETLMSNIETQNGLLVVEFENLLAKDPLNPDAPKWLFQIAEFHYQMAHYAYLRARRNWLTALDACSEDESTCPPEPVADYRQSISDYRRLLTTYPAYEKLDDVLFRLGDALIRNQQPKEGVSYLHRLTQEYPHYTSLDAAWLALGEFYFSQKITGTAQAAYQKLLDDYPESDFSQYARYKLAWTYLNLGDEASYETAISLFREVVESIDVQYASAIGSDGLIDENKLNSGALSFRNQALNDLTTTYVELPGGWKLARTYLESKLPPDRARDKIEQLGGILESQGKFEEEIELYGDLIAQSPTHPHRVEWHISRIDAYTASNRLDEAERETRAAISALLPEGEWARVNAGDHRAMSAARRFSSGQIYRLAMDSVVRAEKLGASPEAETSWADAEDLLRLERSHYLSDDIAFDVEYTFAYILDERSDRALLSLKKQYARRLKSEPELARDVLTKLREAAAAYQTIVDWKDPGDAARQEQIQIAANRQVFVYANVLASSDPDWSIVNSAKAQNFVEEKRGSEVLKKEPLSQAELDFVRSAEQFANRYPKDEETPAFLWRAAEIYRSRNDYEQAAQRFDQIVTHFPSHQYAAVAVGSMFELYSKAQNYEKIEFWAKWLIEHRNFKHYTAAELEDTAAFAIDRQAVAQAEDGHLDDAVSTVLRIESAFPSRIDLATAARFKAAGFEESRLAYRKAISWMEPLLEGPERRRASFQIGRDALEISRFEESAAAFERAASLGFEALKTAKTDEERATIRLQTAQSVYYAAWLYKNSDQPERAAQVLDAYLTHNESGEFALYRQNDAFFAGSTFPENADPVWNSPLASLERAALENPEEASSRLSALLKTPQLSPELSRRIALQKAQYDIDARHSADATQTLASMSPDDTWTNADAARYLYLRGRSAQLDFEDVALEFPIRTLRKRIEQKAKLRQTAEKFYQQAITRKNAQVSTASAYELAQMALHFRDAFRNLPAPKELENDPEGLDEYTTWIEDELIFPAEDAAASLLDIAHQITLQLQSYTPQAFKSAQSLAELKPDLFPVSHASPQDSFPP